MSGNELCSHHWWLKDHRQRFASRPEARESQINGPGGAQTLNFMLCSRGGNIMGVAWGYGALKPSPQRMGYTPHPGGWGKVRLSHQ